MHLKCEFKRKHISTKIFTQSWRRSSQAYDGISNLHRSLIVPHTLTDFEIKSYYKCESKHAGVYSQNK